MIHYARPRVASDIGVREMEDELGDDVREGSRGLTGPKSQSFEYCGG